MDTSGLKQNYLFKSIDVWCLVDKVTLLRYRCFEVLPQKKYCVQSSDFYNSPITSSQLENHERQYIELLLECPPNSRDDLYDTLEEAISAHEKDFTTPPLP